MAQPQVNVTQIVQEIEQAQQGSVQAQAVQVQVSPAPDGSVTIQAQPVTVTIEQQPVSVNVAETSVQIIDVGTQGPQGPPGQSGAAPIFESENKTAQQFLIGQILATEISGSGVVLASAADDTLNCVGLATIGVTPGLDETVQYGGIFSLNDWTAITGTVTIGPQVYYLSPITPGTLTPTAPTTPGQVVQVIGRGISSNQMELINTVGIQL